MSCPKGMIKIRVAFLVIYVLLQDCAHVINGTIPAESSSAHTSLECYGSDLSPVCTTGSNIAITSYHDGFKAASLNCPVDGTASGACCSYDASGDCLQEAPTESRYVDAFSGRDFGFISTSSVVPFSGGACDSLSFSAASVFSQLNFLCIPDSRINEMCVSSTYVSTDGSPVYVQNQGYTSGNSIPTSDVSCSCSVEALSATSNIVVYTIHADLHDTTSDCHQSLVFKDADNNEMKRIECADPSYNTISSETLSINYVSLELTNSFMTTNAGKFWIGFEASDGSTTIKMSCPAGKIDCGTLISPVNGAVSLTSTDYGGVATYSCNSGYVHSSGDLIRTCQVDSTWNGSAAICLYDCGALSDPDNGAVSVHNTTSGSTVTYSCDANFTLDGDITRTCVDVTGWSGPEPSCYECQTDGDCSTGMVCIGGLCQASNSGKDDQSASTSNIGAIVGGTVGGIVVAIGIVIGIVYYNKRKTRFTGKVLPITCNNKEIDGMANNETNNEKKMTRPITKPTMGK